MKRRGAGLWSQNWEKEWWNCPVFWKGGEKFHRKHVKSKLKEFSSQYWEIGKEPLWTTIEILKINRKNVLKDRKIFKLSLNKQTESYN